MATRPDNNTKNKAPSAEKFKNIYMDENSPKNPFGPNYFSIPYMSKVAYKYNKMKNFILPDKKDVLKKEDEEAKFLGTLLLGFTCGIALGGLGKMVAKRIMPNLHDLLEVYEYFYYPIISSVTASYAYFQAHDRYNHQVCLFFVQKYLKQAVENGFEDYEISK